MFCNREDAAYQLAQQLKDRELHEPLVLAIPRGGVVTGAVLACELDAELDVVLSRKLRAPMQPEVALGAVSEDGRIYLDDYGEQVRELDQEYLDEEVRRQRAEIARRKKIIRRIRPQAAVGGRSVIVTDDSIATGSTMIAALQTVRQQNPRELIVAVPVAAPDRLKEVRLWCDDAVCLLGPEEFLAIGRFYEDFSQIEDGQVVDILHEFTPNSREATAVGQT